MVRKTAATPKCMFGTSTMREVVDPLLKERYEAAGKAVPFGDFRRSWYTMHCRRVAPYGDCPYLPTQCASAFLEVALLAMKGDRPGALFKPIAKSHALRRADEAPLPRDRLVGPVPARTPKGSRPGVDAGQHPAPVGGVDAPPRSDTLRRSLPRPVRLGSLFGSFDPGPREGGTDDGEEGT